MKRIILIVLSLLSISYGSTDRSNEWVQTHITRIKNGEPATERANLDKVLDFRAMCVRYGNGAHREYDFWDKEGWANYIGLVAKEGHTAIVWYGANELISTVGHKFLKFENLPEARELCEEDLQKNIAQLKWLFSQVKKHGMRNYLYNGSIQWTKAFGKSHGLDVEMPISPTVHIGHGNPVMNQGVINETTIAYVTECLSEFLRLYENLDGFISAMGEVVPGDRSTFFEHALVPALNKSDRNPHQIISNWEIPIDDFRKNISNKKLYDNTWVLIHGYNAEQLTDPEPYPSVVEWARSSGLPTIVDLYPANVYNFPMNSPRLAYEIVTEMKKIPNFRGYVYWEWSGRVLSRLFRKSMAYYSNNNQQYSDEPWLKILEDQFGDRKAAEHLLRAYDMSARIIPETCALVWDGHDVYRRELRIPYSFLTGETQPYNWSTSRVRSHPLIPVWNYAKWVAKNPDLYENSNGSDFTRNVGNAHTNFRTFPCWRTEGGTVYSVIPSVHMAKIREMGRQSFEEAKAALNYVKKNRILAEQTCKWMKSYQLLTQYYEAKINAAIASMVYVQRQEPERRLAAETLADQAVKYHEEFANFTQENISPIALEINGWPIRSLMTGKSPLDLLQDEKKERENLAQIFNWPKQPPQKP